jgi:hypothetical protein
MAFAETVALEIIAQCKVASTARMRTPYPIIALDSMCFEMPS